MRKIRILGVCCGNGVILHPFLKDDRFEIIAGIEPRALFKTPNDEQWKCNFGEIPLLNSISNTYLEIDEIIGAPDCGANSQLRMSRSKSYGKSTENESFQMFVSSINTYNPKRFWMENLPKLEELVDLKALFPGYILKKNISPVSAYGNPQKSRKRLVLIGIRKDQSAMLSQDYDPFKVMKLQKCSALRKGLEEESYSLAHVREPIDSIITIYAGRKMSLKEIQDYWLSNPGLKRFQVIDRKFTTAPGVYRNLNDGFPSTARKANRQFNEDGLTLSPRELARIQGVPDDFKLVLHKTRPQYWINKGRTSVTKCPPYQISLWIRDIILH